MRVRTAVLAALLVAGVAACSDEPSDQDPTVLPGTGTDFVGALEDVDDLDCRRGADGWDVTGTVTNPSDAPADYRIYVSLLDPQDETQDLNQVDVDDLAAGDTEEWRTRSDAAGDDLRCVLRVERVLRD